MHSVSRVLVVASIALIWGVAPSAAGAQAATVGEARGLFEAGRAAYEAERYGEALEYFERSYALAPDNSILYNAARSAERAERIERAVELYERLHANSTSAAERAESAERLAVLRPRLQARAAPSGGQEGAEAGDTDTEGEGAAVSAPDVSAPDAATDSAPVAYALIGGGAALVVLGAVLLAIGIADADAIGSAPNGTRSWTGASSDIDRAYVLDGVGIASASLGVIGVGVGLGLLASGPSDSPTPTSLRVSVRGQF